VAVLRAEGPLVAWGQLQPLLLEPRLQAHAPLWAVQGEVLARLGRDEDARAAFTHAAGLSGNAREREALLARAGTMATPAD